MKNRVFSLTIKVETTLIISSQAFVKQYKNITYEFQPKNLAVSLVLAALFFSVGCASIVPHPRPWTKREKIAAAFFIAAHTTNAFTTEKHQDHPNLYHETNPILGRHPSDTEIGAYFSITGVATLLIAHLYPELREPLLFGYGGLNTYKAVKDLEMMK